MNLGLFSCLLMMKRNNEYYENIDDLSGLSKNHPMLSLSLLIILFSLAGIPPLAGFFAKFYVFKTVIEQSMYFLAVVGLLSTVVATTVDNKPTTAKKYIDCSITVLKT